MDLKFGDILLFKGKGFISKAIEIVTKSPYSHAAIYIGNYHLVEALPNGISVSHLRDIPTGYDVYRYEGLTDEQKAKMNDFILQKIATKYNYEELFAALLEEELNIKIPFNKSQLICSQFVTSCFKYSLIDLLPNFNKIVKPSNLPTSTIINKIN